MGVVITGQFVGPLGTKMVHEPSGVSLLTEPPLDNGGKGTSFSPTDLLATAYGSCMMSVIALRAKQRGWDLIGMSIRVEKHMSTDTPRRIVRLDVDLALPAQLSVEAREELVHAGINCPVAKSVAADMDVRFKVEYRW